MPASAKQLLLAGVTSARDLGGAARGRASTSANAINAGKIPGPTLYVSGPVHPARAVSRAPSCSAGASTARPTRAPRSRKLADAGVDVIKLIDQDQMTLDEVRGRRRRGAQARPAGRRRTPTGPKRSAAGSRPAWTTSSTPGSPPRPSIRPTSSRMIRERTAKMSRGPLFWTPTIEGLFNYEYLRDNPEKLDDPAWQLGLPPDIVADIRKSIAHPDRLPYFQLTPIRRPTLARKFKQLREAGVVMLVGTDSGIPMKFHSSRPGASSTSGCNILGVPPMEAIRGATYWPSVAMKMDTRRRHGDAGQVRGHHRGARRRAALHRPAAARGHRRQDGASDYK